MIHELQAHLELRSAAFRRHPAFLDEEGAHARIAAYLERLHGGEVFVERRGSEVVSVLALCVDPTPFFGSPVTAVAFDHALEHDPGPWLDRLLPTLLPRLEPDLDLLVDVVYRRAARRFLAHGLRIDSLQLLGDPRLARERLVITPLPPDIELRALRASELDHAIDLQRRAFTAAPEHCWFGGDETYLAQLREGMARELGGPQPLHLAVLQDGELRGHVSAQVAPSVFWGPTAGMSLALAPALRGRGLARPLYGQLLDGMIERGARTFKGGTSQPGVMHLAREMGRPLLGWALRKGATFEPTHFGSFAP